MASEQTQRPPWSPRRRAALIIGLAILLDIALCAGGALVGGYELVAAQHELRGGKLAHADATAHALRDKTAIAGTAFGVARLCFWPWRPLTDLIAAAPPLRAAGSIGPLLDLAADGSAGATRALDGALPVLAATGHKSGGASGDTGQRLLAGLQQGHGAFAAASADIVRAQNDARAIDLGALPAQAGTQLGKAMRLLGDANDALRAALVAPQLLGANGTRTYLIVPENPWDLRATGGFVGTAALLEANQGRINLSSLQSSDAVDGAGTYRRLQDYAPPPLPITTYQHLNGWYYRDANWEPDYPTSAQLLRYFYWLGQRRMPDGVVAFDSALLGPLLQITGPVSVPDIPHPLTAANAVKTLDYYVNAQGTAKDGTPDKQIAALAYTQVFAKLKSIGASQLTEAARALGTALQEKHLLLWTSDPTLRPLLARHGWDGAISPTRSDYLYVVDSNVHYNKINQLIREGLSYHAVVQPDRSLRSTLTITYTNTAYYDSPTATNLPSPQNNALYEDFVRVYAPLGSALTGTAGLTQQWATTRDHDKTVFNGYLRVPSRGRLTVTFSYTVPPNANMDATGYHLTVQKQPGTAITNTIPLAVDVGVSGPGIRVGGGATWNWRGDLNGDVTLTSPLQGGHPTPEPLAYDAAPVAVGPGARIEPWAALPPNLPRPPR